MGENAEQMVYFIEEGNTGRFYPVLRTDFTENEFKTIEAPEKDGDSQELDWQGWGLTPEPKESLRHIREEKLEIPFTWPKRYRCKTRKRFVKLMMSWGVERNQANWFAKQVKGFRGGYQAAYTDEWLKTRVFYGKMDAKKRGRK